MKKAKQAKKLTIKTRIKAGFYFLPHEEGHVVQQKPGRVQPTTGW